MRAAGSGLRVLPCFIAQSEPTLVRLRADEVKLVNSLWAIMHEDQRDLARVRVAVDFLLQAMKQERELFLPTRPAAACSTG